jgi:hypothetical protein
MSRSDPGTWFDRLVGVCLSLLVAAAAVFIAVKLIEAVWSALLVSLGVGLFVAVAIVVVRSRNQGW